MNPCGLWTSYFTCWRSMNRHNEWPHNPAFVWDSAVKSHGWQFSYLRVGSSRKMWHVLGSTSIKDKWHCCWNELYAGAFILHCSKLQGRSVFMWVYMHVCGPFPLPLLTADGTVPKFEWKTKVWQEWLHRGLHTYYKGESFNEGLLHVEFQLKPFQTAFIMSKCSLSSRISTGKCLSNVLDTWTYQNVYSVYNFMFIKRRYMLTPLIWYTFFMKSHHKLKTAFCILDDFFSPLPTVMHFWRHLVLHFIYCCWLSAGT